ncbi:hypothetical protein RHMOL_Rhmol09G0114500 [Rhododendron molle]|uniref:Uncharacterized protein n=1 Tax=Rhododendron molle TaxID=49168 RepID=A0ACC0MCL5_RHOML|nr:hypothetical protein RHMOL_Rhmol09G0114500 [Rhododendron molle]
MDPNILCLMIHFEKDELRNQGDPNKEEGAFSNLAKQIKDIETYCWIGHRREKSVVGVVIREERDLDMALAKSTGKKKLIFASKGKENAFPVV